MKHFLTILLLGGCICSIGVAEADWHYPLYLGNGALWQQRIPIEIRNGMDREALGEPVAVVIGDAAGQAHLAGQQAQALRVCDAEGTEMLFNITGPDGQQIKSGPIPDGATLTIPAECPPNASVTYYAYFDNPKAWQVPDFLESWLQVRNGGVEHGTGDVPAGWQHDAGDDNHRALWVDENPHSGKKCLKTVVSEGAETTWIATRQRGLRIIGGAHYRMTAWVKAESVEGYAGWYIHVGNDEQPMMIESVPDSLQGGDGTYDWTRVSFEFTAPEEANKASLGTVLRGTGTAWFDDVNLEMHEEYTLSAVAGETQELQLQRTGQEAPWYHQATTNDSLWQYRVPVQVVNTSDEQISDALVVVDTSIAQARTRGKLNDDSFRLVYQQRLIPHYHAGYSLFFGDTIPPKTAKTYYLYFSDEPGVEPMPQSGYASLMNSERNLVANPSFENGDVLPDDWPGGTEGERPANTQMGLVESGLFGNRAARIHVPPESEPAWTGWRQHVPVQPGKQYLYAAWVKTENVAPNARIHAHFRNAEGDLCESRQHAGAGPDLQGTNDWTMLSGTFEMPPDIATFQLHLTINATGTVWHDGVLLAEAMAAETGKLQSRMPRQLAAPEAWPVNAVVKVFPTDLPPDQQRSAAITAARNEKEPLQIALRSPEPLGEVQVEVSPPKNANGAVLDDLTVNVVGYVPIDHKTSYYSSQSPTWHRKYPTTPGSCDGWPGMWPDPLLPRSSFDLPAETTQPVWITVSVPKDAPAGDYQGNVEFVWDGGSFERPFSVHVWDFTLPDENHVKAIYDLRLNEAIWRHPNKTLQETHEQFWRFMADRRVCPHRLHPMPTFSRENGEVTADFEQFDKAAEYYFDELGIAHSYTPWHFYCFGWGHLPGTKWGERPYEGEYPFEDADHNTLRPEYKTVYQSALRTFWNHIKQKGWEDRFVLYISDEPWDTRLDRVIQQMKACCDMIHEVDPDIPIYSSTWHHQPEWNGYIDVWGFGHYGRVTTETINQLQDSGDTIWWTTDGQMCTDTPYCAIERLLPHYCFKYDAQAYEFWGIDWLTYDPYEFGWHSYIHQSGAPGDSRWVRYPNGDGFLAYPGGPVGHDGPVSSVRLEQAREGVEDYEYLYMLRNLIRQARAAGKNVEKQQQALDSATSLVERPCEIGRYSTKILPEPDRLLAIKRQLAEAIQSLSE